MTRVTRSKTVNLIEDVKENQSNNKTTEDSLITPRKRSNKDKSADCSPPKNLKNEENSPGITSKFRSSLTLGEENDAKEPKARSKYSNARRALTSNENYNLPGREKEIDELKKFIDAALKDKKSCSLYISGTPGTGKTAALMKILNTKEYQKQLQTAYVNCTSISSIGSIYKRIVSALDLDCRGSTEKDYCNCIETSLTKTNKKSSKMTMIILDEIDFLSAKTQSVLYRIFEWPSWENSHLILVGIANALDLTDRLLTRLQTKCELQPTLMHFEAYTKAQIVEIFKSRLEEAKVLDLFSETTLQLLAAKVSSVSGDVRRALDIGRRVIDLAQHGTIDSKKIEKEILKETTETNEQQKPVQIKEVLSVLNDVYGNYQKLQEDSDAFPVQQKMMICALLLIVKNDKNKDITIGRLHDVYKKVCLKRNLSVLDQSEFMNICELVESRGIVRLQKKKECRTSRIYLSWDENLINATLKDKQLITAILEDKSCLSR